MKKFAREMARYGIEALMWTGTVVVVWAAWVVLELMLEGSIQPSISDTIIGGLFALSLLAHIKPRLPILFGKDSGNSLN